MFLLSAAQMSKLVCSWLGQLCPACHGPWGLLKGLLQLTKTAPVPYPDVKAQVLLEVGGRLWQGKSSCLSCSLPKPA